MPAFDAIDFGRTGAGFKSNAFLRPRRRAAAPPGHVYEHPLSGTAAAARRRRTQLCKPLSYPLFRKLRAAGGGRRAGRRYSERGYVNAAAARRPPLRVSRIVHRFLKTTRDAVLFYRSVIIIHVKEHISISFSRSGYLCFQLMRKSAPRSSYPRKSCKAGPRRVSARRTGPRWHLLRPNTLTGPSPAPRRRRCLRPPGANSDDSTVTGYFPKEKAFISQLTKCHESSTFSSDGITTADCLFTTLIITDKGKKGIGRAPPRPAGERTPAQINLTLPYRRPATCPRDRPVYFNCGPRARITRVPAARPDAGVCARSSALYPPYKGTGGTVLALRWSLRPLRLYQRLLNTPLSYYYTPAFSTGFDHAVIEICASAFVYFATNGSDLKSSTPANVGPLPMA
ncbi:hypothetical protein EVAR_4950_1 [Eumeta japonica]|uniref:Uncharacterized protein n=1 Tax=Eumeta variegata TaxID=151549 RepID=A0A4C1V0Y7_EUMVA|nr:hypothetical protein EVAR_4950_1 [Eumeta japonica]